MVQLKENSWYEICVLLCAFDDQQSAGRSFSGVQRPHVPSHPPQKGLQWFHPNLSRQVSPFPRYTNTLQVISLTQRLWSEGHYTQNVISCWTSGGLLVLSVLQAPIPFPPVCSTVNLSLITLLARRCVCVPTCVLVPMISVFLSSLEDLHPHMLTIASGFLAVSLIIIPSSSVFTTIICMPPSPSAR